MIVGIDLGSRSCGWAVLSSDGTRRDSGAWHLALRPATKTRPADHRATRWLAMLERSRQLLEKWRPAALVYERPVGRADGGGRATFLLHGGLLAQLEIAAFGLDYELPIVELSPGEDDAAGRLAALPKMNSAAVRAMGDNLLTIRIDLDP